MKILALEFSSTQRSVAVLNLTGADARRQASEVIESGAGGTRGLALVEQALRAVAARREEIQCVAVGLGPGSYTGIRAAIALAQGWQLGRGVKLLGISSAECIAAQACAEGLAGRAHVILDAQREEFYAATYELDAGAWPEVAPLRLTGLSEVRARIETGGMAVGPEITRWFPSGRIVFPRAATLGRLAAARSDFVEGEKLEPIYLRPASFVKTPPARAVI